MASRIGWVGTICISCYLTLVSPCPETVPAQESTLNIQLPAGFLNPFRNLEKKKTNRTKNSGLYAVSLLGLANALSFEEELFAIRYCIPHYGGKREGDAKLSLPFGPLLQESCRKFLSYEPTSYNTVVHLTPFFFALLRSGKDPALNTLRLTFLKW